MLLQICPPGCDIMGYAAQRASSLFKLYSSNPQSETGQFSLTHVSMAEKEVKLHKARARQ